MRLKRWGDDPGPVTGIGLGVFDGVHLGHQALWSKCSALLTFDPHPITALKGIQIQRLTTIKEMQYYIPDLYVLTFNQEIAKLTPASFLDQVMTHEIQPQKIVVGYDYRFGAKKAGNFEYLTEWAGKRGVSVEKIAPVNSGGFPVKSSRVRDALISGDIAQAVQLMGHSYLMIGTVIHGEGRGKVLGFPTANIQVPDNKLIPGDGVYAGSVIWQEQDHKAVISIGKKPTFAKQGSHIEVHIPGFSEDIYGHELSLFIEKRIRDQQTFPDQDALVAQIKQDLTNII